MRPAALLLLALLPLQLEAQTPRVVFRGRGEPALDARLRQLLRDPGRQLWTADTLIARSDTVRAPLLIVGATVRLEGVILSDVTAVGADLFVRPTARVLGNVWNIGGGWYASDLATISGHLDDRPNAPYAVERTDVGLIIRGTRHPRVLALYPVTPGYDRVDGLSPAVGARLLLPTAADSSHAPCGAAIGRTRPADGGAAARLRSRTALEVGAERTTLTNGDPTLANALSFLWDGNDIRDY
jgi:hypothetical protein